MDIDAALRATLVTSVFLLALAVAFGAVVFFVWVALEIGPEYAVGSFVAVAVLLFWLTIYLEEKG